MALIKCNECGKEMSNKAKQCPHCGTKLKKRNNILLFLTFGLSMVIIIIAIMIFISNKNNTTIKEYIKFTTISDVKSLNDVKKNEKAIILYIYEDCSWCKKFIDNIEEIKGYKITIYVVDPYKDFTDEEIAEITKGFVGFPIIQLYSNNTLIKQEEGMQETDKFFQFLKENNFL